MAILVTQLMSDFGHSCRFFRFRRRLVFCKPADDEPNTKHVQTSESLQQQPSPVNVLWCLVVLERGVKGRRAENSRTEPTTDRSNCCTEDATGSVTGEQRLMGGNVSPSCSVVSEWVVRLWFLQMIYKRLNYINYTKASHHKCCSCVWTQKGLV